MSNIYIQEPPTEGKVLLATSAGEIEIELWSKEAPKACRNFVQLCLEGYYNGIIFHRVVRGFIVQGGDPTGTGSGGESIYGEPFKDEFHQRLRFVRRGLVAMANAGPNDNGSQFFFTLGPCPELQNKHTVFGKVSGDTVYNLPRFEEGDIGKDDRPEFPHKIVSTKVLKNPFPDIEPRIATKIVNEIPSEELKKRKKATKDFNLLSFGDEAEEEELISQKETKRLSKTGKSAHDFAVDSALSADIVDDKEDRENALTRIKQKLLKEKKATKIIEAEMEKQRQLPDEVTKRSIEREKKREAVQSEIKKLKREMKGDKTSSHEASSPTDSAQPTPPDVMKQYLQDISRYSEAQDKLPKDKYDRESQTLALLKRFANKIKDIPETVPSTDSADEDEENDDKWLSSKLNFDDGGPVLAKDANTKDDNWYDLDDPRNALNKRRREKKPAVKA